MTFIWPWMLLSLLLVPLLIAVYLRLLRRRQRSPGGARPAGLVQNESGRPPGGGATCRRSSSPAV